MERIGAARTATLIRIARLRHEARNADLDHRSIDLLDGCGDRFGKSASVSGTTLVVGAYFEFGGSAGINGNQADNSKSQAGAIYIFQQ